MMGVTAGLMLGLAAAQTGSDAIRLDPARPASAALAPGRDASAVLRLRAGESADLAVLQEGIDVVVEAFSPDGTPIAFVDSPNGRQGDEPISLFATSSGLYRLAIRPISADEPEGRITIRIVALRDAAQTRALLAERRRARLEAAAWLRPNDAPLPPLASFAAGEPLPLFDAFADSARVIGLGEATHGSREFNDFRLAAVQRLVRRHGYRLVALEDSSFRWRRLAPYVQGETSVPAAPLEWGWIGRRARRALLDWVRQWNLDHPADRVRIVGVDPQDSFDGRERLGNFLEQAYGERLTAQWRQHLPELEAAEEQIHVFGDSGTSAALRSFLMELSFQMAGDGPLLRARFGDEAYEEALVAAQDLAAFADFNTGSGAIVHSRDRHMALRVLRAIDETPGRPKAIYWGHNAHVSATPTRWGPTGALLRQALGCGYRPLAATFGQGAFVAQKPNDPDDRLLVNTLSAPADETIETVLSLVRAGAHMALWGCEGSAGEPPAWLRSDRPLRWIGGLYAPETHPSQSYQPYRLTGAFDGIVFFPSVGADTIPTDRPSVPPRRRPEAEPAGN